MRPWITRYMVAHVNTEFSETLRNFGALQRVSDHDFPVASFSLQQRAVRPAGVVNAASWLSGAVAPAEIVSIFGAGFTGSTTVSFNGVSAPVLYRSSTQMNVFVPQLPFLTATAEMRVGQFTYTMPLQSSAPGLFRPILNHDYSVNSTARPAARGSTIMLWGTGAGLTGPVTALVGTIPAVVEYAGGAPGLPAGVFQVNVRVPDDASPGDAVPIRLTMQSRSTQPDVTIAVR
jgi:uncharacterized protein (TIGR03437 family)